MRVECPCGCGHRFDVPIRAVMAEADRLRQKQKKSTDRRPASQINGNVLSPQDLEAKRLRDEAVRKRLGSKII